MNGLLASLASFLSSHLWLGPFVAFLAGVLTSFTPCSLSTVPLILGYVGSDREQTRSRAFRLSLGYAVALAVTNTALGVVASLLGHMVLGGRWGRLFLAVLLVVMALQTWGVVNVIPSSYLTSKHKQKGLPGAFLAGVLASLFSIPCTTPFLVSLLALVADKGSLYWGALLRTGTGGSSDYSRYVCRLAQGPEEEPEVWSVGHRFECPSWPCGLRLLAVPLLGCNLRQKNHANKKIKID